MNCPICNHEMRDRYLNKDYFDCHICSVYYHSRTDSWLCLELFTVVQWIETPKLQRLLKLKAFL